MAAERTWEEREVNSTSSSHCLLLFFCGFVLVGTMLAKLAGIVVVEEFAYPGVPLGTGFICTFTIWTYVLYMLLSAVLFKLAKSCLEVLANN